MRLIHRRTQQPIAARLRAFFDAYPGPYAPADAEALLDLWGNIHLTGGQAIPARKLARLEIHPLYGGAWSLALHDHDFDPDPNAPSPLPLDPIQDTDQDAAHLLFGPGSPQDGQGVKVALIDTGVGPHPDLAHVQGEPDSSWPSSHGTLVAGIIGARSQDRPGLAPGAELVSYRVFPAKTTHDNDLANAIQDASLDGCHLVNLSLGIAYTLAEARQRYPLTCAAIEQAAREGVLLFVAAGNDHQRRPISFPANHPDCLAVSSFGVERTFPETSTYAAERTQTLGQDPTHFLAAHTNVGPELHLIAPGVANLGPRPVRSTTEPLYCASLGTSFATPCAVGTFARLLSRPQHAPILLLGADPNDPDQARQLQDRRAQMLDLLTRSARDLGFAPHHQGIGLLDP